MALVNGQVVVLALNPSFGWSASLLGWMSSFSLVELLLPNRQPALFNFVCGIVLLVVLAAIADATYVAYMFKNSNFKHVWPLKLLRFMVSILVTAGFVPTVGILITPLSCDTMKMHNGADFECWSAHRVVFLVLSLGTLLLYLPFGLASSLVFHESDGNSNAITAKVSGREAMFGTIAKLLAVVGGQVADDHPIMVATVMTCSYAILGLYVATTLPFFNPYMNQFRVAASFLVASVSFGSVILSIAKPASPGTFSAIWIGCTIVITALAGQLPRLRMQQLHARLVSMRPRMLEELDQKHNTVPHRWHTTHGSVRLVQKGTKAHQRRARRVSITELAGRVRNARFRQARLPLGMIDEVLEKEVAEDKTVFDGMSAYEVELIVRCELNMPGNKDRRRRKFGANRIVPTTQAVEHAMWLFVQAIEEFCDDPVDVASVKIEYARFLQVFTADVNLATAALESAKKEQPSIEGEFEVFSRCRGLQQKRQSQNLGAERDMNLIALVEYGKRLNRAITAHDAALDYQLKLVNTVSRHRGRIELDDDAMAERLGGYVQAMRDSVDTANGLYRRLLTTHPNAPHLGAIYARFCTDLMNDEQLAAQFSTDETGTANGSQAGSKAGTAQGGSLMGSFKHGTEVLGKSLRSFIPKTRTKEVSFLKTQFRAGTVMLMIIAVAMFATTHSLLTTTSNEVAALGRAGLQRKLIVSTAFHARSLALDNMNPATVRTMLAHVATFKQVFRDVHAADWNHGSVAEHWHNPTIPVATYAGNGSWYQEKINLYDLSVRVAADMQQMSVEGLGHNYSENKHWRFVMDNAVPHGLPAFMQLLDLLRDAILNRLAMFAQVQGGLVAALALVLFILGYCVFRRAFVRIVVIKRAVLEIAVALSAEQLTTLVHRAKRAKSFVARARVKAAGVVDPSNDPEGDGPLTHFSTPPVRHQLPQRPAQLLSVETPRPTPSNAVSNNERPPSSSVAGHSIRRRPNKTKTPTPRPTPDPERAARDITGTQSQHTWAESRGVSFATGSNPSHKHKGAEEILVLQTKMSKKLSSISHWTGSTAITALHSRSGAMQMITSPQADERPTNIQGIRRVGPAITPGSVLLEGSGCEEAGSGSDAYQREALDRIDSSANLFQVWAESATVTLGLGHGTSSGHVEPELAQELVQATAPLLRHNVDGASVATEEDDACSVATEDDNSPRFIAQYGERETKTQPLAEPGVPAVVVRESDGAVVEVPDLEDIMNATPGAVVLADSQGTIMYANEHFTRMLGYSRKAAVGSSLALFVPSESIKSLQDMIRRLVVTGSVSNGTSEYKDGQGTQVDVLSNMGEAVPMLLNVNRTQFGGRYWVVLDMQDLRNHIQPQDDAEPDNSDIATTRHASSMLIRQVVGALLMVGLLQCLNVLVGFAGLKEIGGRSSEISMAGIQRCYGHLLTFQAREAVIGDNQLWSSAQAAEHMRETINLYDQVRFGMLFGDAALGLEGSARRNAAIDTIQFGGTETGELKLGIMSEIHSFLRAARDIVRDFRSLSSSVGPSLEKLNAVPELRYMMDTDASGKVFEDLTLSARLYREDSEETAAGIQTVNVIISSVHMLLVALLYLIVFRRMVRVLMRQAARSEAMLLGLPEDMAASPKLQQYFVRVSQ